MAQRIGKCTNYSGCKLAYRNEKITVVTKDFRCPECGSPLEPVGPKRGVSPVLVLSIGVAAVLILAIGAILWTLSAYTQSYAHANSSTYADTHADAFAHVDTNSCTHFNPFGHAGRRSLRAHQFRHHLTRDR